MAAYEAGDYVNVEMADEGCGECEWLWVRVERCDDQNRVLFGRVDSQTVVFASELSLGQEVAVSFANVREHKKLQDF